MIEYEIDVNLKVKVGDKEITIPYNESGSGPEAEDLSDYLDGFVGFRFDGIKSTIMNKVKAEFV